MAKYSHRIQADRRTVTSRGMYIYGNTVRQAEVDRKSTRLNSSHWNKSRMPSSA